ncbi:hypothetical protein SBA3_4340009 [Candidatus Sulfopaludibacter sp. SbA3]|nr:hypothetical protein SBA3_4340009 [Candidatus Sulfopaludibacter sp. SbA3]
MKNPLAPWDRRSFFVVCLVRSLRAFSHWTVDAVFAAVKIILLIGRGAPRNPANRFQESIADDRCGLNLAAVIDNNTFTRGLNEPDDITTHHPEADTALAPDLAPE